MGESPIQRIIEATFDLSRILRFHMMLAAREGTQVNFLQINALLLVSDQEGMTMKEFADALKISRPSATSFINRLSRLGWISRTRDAENRRIVHLSLTAQGKKVLHEKKGMREQAIRKLLHNLSPEELSSLAGILDKLHMSSDEWFTLPSSFRSLS